MQSGSWSLFKDLLQGQCRHILVLWTDGDDGRLRGVLVGVVWVFVCLVSGSYGSALRHRARHPLSERWDSAARDPAGAEGEGVDPVKERNGQGKEKQRGGMSMLPIIPMLSSPWMTYKCLLTHTVLTLCWYVLLSTYYWRDLFFPLVLFMERDIFIELHIFIF